MPTPAFAVRRRAAIDGFASAMARLLDDRFFIVFLGNMRQIPQNRIMNDLWNTILGYDVDLTTIE